MMDEQAIREFERRAKEQGLTQAQIQEYNQTRTSEAVKQGRALFAKHGFCSPFEGLAETPGEMVPEVDPGKMEAAWRDGFRTFGFSGARPLSAGNDEAWAARYRCSQLKLIESINLAIDQAVWERPRRKVFTCSIRARACLSCAPSMAP